MSKNLILYGKSVLTNELDSLTLVSKNLEDCEIVFMEDASIGAVLPEQVQHLTNTKYCLIEDVEARGFNKSQVSENFKQLTYMDLIDLIDSTDRLISLL